MIQKKFDSVKMMRDIRAEVDKEISDMTSEQILSYLKQAKEDYDREVYPLSYHYKSAV